MLKHVLRASREIPVLADAACLSFTATRDVPGLTEQNALNIGVTRDPVVSANTPKLPGVTRDGWEVRHDCVDGVIVRKTHTRQDAGWYGAGKPAFPSVE